jgi:hypothetical protein
VFWMFMFMFIVLVFVQFAKIRKNIELLRRLIV